MDKKQRLKKLFKTLEIIEYLEPSACQNELSMTNYKFVVKFLKDLIRENTTFDKYPDYPLCPHCNTKDRVGKYYGNVSSEKWGIDRPQEWFCINCFKIFII